MGETLKGLERNGQLVALLNPYVFIAPANTVTYFCASVDLSAASDGDNIAVTNKRGGIPTNLMLTVNDNAGTNLAVTVLVDGVDRFGAKISETLESPAGTSGVRTVYGTKVFKEVTKITLTDVENGAASDTLNIGVPGGTTSAIYGLPCKCRKDSSNGYAGDYDGLQVFTKNGTPQSGAQLSANGDGVTNVSCAGGNQVELWFDFEHTYE